ncbi:hypothetical protein CGRA01v4_07094 [Colletotrichum graminicola]|nr:hypothetical protein CGRA01v4_07094 [Colletotrichum graminicola]
MFPDTSSLRSRRHTSLDCIVTLLRLARSGSLASTSSLQPRAKDEATPGHTGSTGGSSIKQAFLSQGGGYPRLVVCLGLPTRGSQSTLPCPAFLAPPSQYRPTQWSPAPLAM